MARRKRSEHYVNNKEFLAALIKYREDVEIARLQDKIKPVIPRYIGECFLKIANHLSFKPNFVNYMFKEDMISDGIENCVQYIHNFDPEKSKNPFAYFTQIIHYAFLRRIQREKRQLEIKNKILEKSGYSEVFDDNNQIDGSTYSDYNSIKDAVHSKSRNWMTEVISVKHKAFIIKGEYQFFDKVKSEVLRLLKTCNTIPHNSSNVKASTYT